jgi:hypothetical protein
LTGEDSEKQEGLSLRSLKRDKNQFPERRYEKKISERMVPGIRLRKDRIDDTE